jgi:hypothetical protein
MAITGVMPKKFDFTEKISYNVDVNWDNLTKVILFLLPFGRECEINHIYFS